MNERIKKLRRTLDLTQQEFADRLGIKRGGISNYEIGRNEPADSVVSLICREFNVNEEWLRNGTGEMFLPTDRNADIARLTKQLLDEESDSFKNRLISILSNLSVEEWQYLEKRAKELCGIDDLHNSE
nr:MAG TPA: helix-turn-helix domain protein [Caudoviricetes sp.]